MSEDIDKHVLKKYEVGQKVGKGVHILAICFIREFEFHFLNLGLRHCVESHRQKNASRCCTEKNIRCISSNIKLSSDSL